MIDLFLILSFSLTGSFATATQILRFGTNSIKWTVKWKPHTVILGCLRGTMTSVRETCWNIWSLNKNGAPGSHWEKSLPDKPKKASKLWQLLPRPTFTIHFAELHFTFCSFSTNVSTLLVLFWVFSMQSRSTMATTIEQSREMMQVDDACVPFKHFLCCCSC